MKKTIAASFTALLLAGCAGPSYVPPAANSNDYRQSYNQSYDKVWESVVDWFAMNNIPIKTIEKDSGMVGSEYALAAGFNQLDCGVVTGGDLAAPVSSSAVANINVLVRKQGDQVSVQPNVFGRANYQFRDVFNGAPLPTVNVDRCETTGLLEKSLHDYISKG